MRTLMQFFTYKILLRSGLAGLLLIVFSILFIVGWFYTYRFEWIIDFGKSPLMEKRSIEGYTDKLHYSKSDTASLYIRSESSDGQGVLRYVSSPYDFDTLRHFRFGRVSQRSNPDPAVMGCNWNKTTQFLIPDSFKSGIYNLHLTCKSDTSNITFSVGTKDKEPEVAILLPISTWVAYNQWGGKSLYRNGIDSSKVYTVSAHRPMTALNYGRKRRLHSVPVQANICNWFQKQYATAILPDYSLETMPKSLKEADVVVLAYHCEYFSDKMYDNLKAMVSQQNTSLISLGANQVYWKVRWHENFNQMECHKDLTFFKNSWSLGGMWKHNLRPESSFLGVRYTNAGMGTYAPYKVKRPGHWLFEGASLAKGDLFGRKGINHYPICGDETDETDFFTPSDAKVIAKGLNPENGDRRSTYHNNPSWQGEGGGEMVFRSISDEAGILATSSIHSGSGLGQDAVMDTVINNFIDRYR